MAVGSLRLEAIRMNELFARPQHKCANRRVIGGLKDSFFVCFDGTKVNGESGTMFGSVIWKENRKGTNKNIDKLAKQKFLNILFC
jgi:hypothetical protein